MGDGTAALQVQVWDCSPGQRPTALAVIHRYGAAGRKHLAEGLDLAVTYVNAEVHLGGMVRDLAAELEQAAASASFIAWQDPCQGTSGTSLGEVIMRTPQLGEFTGDCDGEGQAVINRDQLAAEAWAAKATRTPLDVALNLALGGPWYDARDAAGRKGGH